MICPRRKQCCRVELGDQDIVRGTATVRPLDDLTRRAQNGPESGEWQSHKNVTFGLQNDVNDN